MPVLKNLLHDDPTISLLQSILNETVNILTGYTTINSWLLGHAPNELAVRDILEQIQSGEIEQLSTILNGLEALVTEEDDLPDFINTIRAYSAQKVRETLHNSTYILYRAIDYHTDTKANKGVLALFFDLLGTLDAPLQQEIFMDTCYDIDSLNYATTHLKSDPFNQFIDLAVVLAEKLNASDPISSPGNAFIARFIRPDKSADEDSPFMRAAIYRPSSFTKLFSLLQYLTPNQKKLVLIKQRTKEDSYPHPVHPFQCIYSPYSYTILSLLMKNPSANLPLFIQEIALLDNEAQIKLVSHAIIYCHYRESFRSKGRVQTNADFSPAHWETIHAHLETLRPLISKKLLIDILQSPCPEHGSAFSSKKTLLVSLIQHASPAYKDSIESLIAIVSQRPLLIKTILFSGNSHGTLLAAGLKSNDKLNMTTHILKAQRTLKLQHRQKIFSQLNFEQLVTLATLMEMEPVIRELVIGEIYKFDDKTVTRLLTRLKEDHKNNAFMALLAISTFFPDLRPRIARLSLDSQRQIYTWNKSDNNALMVAIEKKQDHAVEILIDFFRTNLSDIEQRAILELRDENGNNALMLAILYDSKTFDLLLKWVVSLDKDHQIKLFSQENGKKYNAVMLLLKYQPERYERVKPIIDGFGDETIKRLDQRSQSKPLISLFFRKEHNTESTLDEDKAPEKRIS